MVSINVEKEKKGKEQKIDKLFVIVRSYSDEM